MSVEDLASLGLVIGSDGVLTASQRLKQLVQDGAAAEKQGERLRKAYERNVKADFIGRLKNDIAELEKPGQRSVSMLKSFASAAAVAGGAIAAVGAAAMVVGAKITRELVAYEGLIARLEGATGSASGATTAFDALEKISDKTIYTEEQMAQAFISLRQAGLSPTETLLKSLANTASATGSSLEEISGAAAGVAMGYTRGWRTLRVRAEEEGDKLKLTFKGVTTTIDNSASAIQGYLAKMGNASYLGAAERQLDTMGGSVKKLKDAWGDLFRDVGRSSVGVLIKDGLEGATTAVEGLTKALTSSKVKDAVTYLRKLWVAGMGAVTGESAAELDARYRVIDLENMQGDLSPEEERAFAARAASKDKGFVTTGSAEDIVKGFDPLAGEEPSKDKRDKNAALKAKAALAYQVKIAKDLQDFERKMRDTRAEDVRKELEAYDQAEGEKITAIREGLRSEVEVLTEAYAERKRIIELAATDEEKGGLLDKAKADFDRGMREYQNQQQSKKDALLDGLRTEEEEIALSQERRRGILDDAYADELITQTEHMAAVLKLQEDTDKKRRDLTARYTDEALGHSADMFGTLAAMVEDYGGKQSSVYKGLFAVSKAFGIAQTGVAIATGIANAQTLTWPANLVEGLRVAALGAQLMSQISSASYAGAYDAGGSVPPGKWAVVGERRPEIVRGPAQVVGGQATGQMMGAGGSKVTIYNHVDMRPALRDWARTSEGQTEIMNVVSQNRATIRRLVGA